MLPAPPPLPPSSFFVCLPCHIPPFYHIPVYFVCQHFQLRSKPVRSTRGKARAHTPSHYSPGRYPTPSPTHTLDICCAWLMPKLYSASYYINNILDVHKIKISNSDLPPRTAIVESYLPAPRSQDRQTNTCTSTTIIRALLCLCFVPYPGMPDGQTDLHVNSLESL